MEKEMQDIKHQLDVVEPEEIHDIEHDKLMVEQEQEVVMSGGIDEEPERSKLTVGLILTVALIAIGAFIVITYLPGLFVK